MERLTCCGHVHTYIHVTILRRGLLSLHRAVHLFFSHPECICVRVGWQPRTRGALVEKSLLIHLLCLLVAARNGKKGEPPKKIPWPMGKSSGWCVAAVIAPVAYMCRAFVHWAKAMARADDGIGKSKIGDSGTVHSTCTWGSSKRYWDGSWGR